MLMVSSFETCSARKLRSPVRLHLGLPAVAVLVSLFRNFNMSLGGVY